MRVLNKPRLLFIIHLPPPVHGAAVMNQYLFDSKFLRINYFCHFINLSISKNISELGKNYPIKYFRLFKLMILVIKDKLLFKPDLCYVTINVNGPAFYKDLFIILLLKLLHTKLVYHLHNKGIVSRQSHFINDALYKIAFKNTFSILLSPLLYPDIQKYVPPERVAYCPNGIKDNVQTGIQKNASDKCHLLFLSNMMEEKGVYDLLEACKILKQRNYNFMCDFVGQWSDISEKSFNLKIREYNLGSTVRTFGIQLGKNKELFFINSDIFVLPTYYYKESFPLVNLEAMQYNLPVISTKEGGIPDAVENGVTGYLVNKQDPKDLADKIENLLLNPSLRIKMGIAGRKKFETNYSLSMWETRIKNILDEILNNYYYEL